MKTTIISLLMISLMACSKSSPTPTVTPVTISLSAAASGFGNNPSTSQTVYWTSCSLDKASANQPVYVTIQFQAVDPIANKTTTFTDIDTIPKGVTGVWKHYTTTAPANGNVTTQNTTITTAICSDSNVTLKF